MYGCCLYRILTYGLWSLAAAAPICSTQPWFKLLPEETYRTQPSAWIEIDAWIAVGHVTAVSPVDPVSDRGVLSVRVDHALRGSPPSTLRLLYMNERPRLNPLAPDPCVWPAESTKIGARVALVVIPRARFTIACEASPFNAESGTGDHSSEADLSGVAECVRLEPQNDSQQKNSIEVLARLLLLRDSVCELTVLECTKRGDALVDNYIASRMAEIATGK